MRCPSCTATGGLRPQTHDEADVDLSYKEVCSKCKKEYLRGFDTLATRHDRWSHLTGRFCTFPCGGALKVSALRSTVLGRSLKRARV